MEDHNLSKKKCVPCEGGTKPLKPRDEEFRIYHAQVPDWNVEEETKITKKFRFRDFAQALNFINRIGEIAEEEQHHPDMCLFSWNRVSISLTTHAIGGLSVNDFILAHRINGLNAQQT